MRTQSVYAKAGVNIDSKMAALRSIKRMVGSTRVPGVLNEIGAFGGFFRSPGKDRVLIASTDGVGTKTKVAALAGRHDGIGHDIVNHCVNDILVHGASPLFFLDYFGTARFARPVFRQVVSGLCSACRDNGCALLGGETAEMPGLYPPGEYDLVGTIVGCVRKHEIVTGASIHAGCLILGLPSSGLHTNGYSLARRVIFETAGLRVSDRLPGTSRTVGSLLLAPHRSYLAPIRALMKKAPILGMAHITGGGFPDNIARIMPAGLSATINRSSWSPPAIFRFIGERADVPHEEMYRVFNMGIGMVVFVSRSLVGRALNALNRVLPGCRIIGSVERGAQAVRLTTEP